MTDTEILDFLQGREVDAIYFDDGEMVDVKNGDVRQAIVKWKKGHTPARLNSPQADVDAFNETVPVGTLVRYWKMAREGEPSGTSKTSTMASVLSGHTAVVWIEGCSGCVALSHVEVIQ